MIHDSTQGGFTFIELLLVFFVVIFIAALTIPVGVNFYRSQTLSETTSDVLGAARRAQAQAMFQKNDSDFGVKFLSDSYVLFQGSSYATRVQSEDEIFFLPTGITAGGIDEVVFRKLAGTASLTGVLAVSSGGSSQGIAINREGKVERQ